MKDNILLICPNSEKINILKSYSEDSKLHNIKFMTKKEFIDNFFFTYDERAYQYLMDNYGYNLDVCKIYLKNLYPIDINKKYIDSKLNFLKNIKQELIENNLLIENPFFKEYIKTKKIEVKNYYDLDKYEEIALNLKKEIPKVKLNCDVVECNTLEEEVNDTCLNILKLLNEGIDINKIYLSNVSNDYLYTIKKLFKYYNIPINLDMNYSIYSTKIVSDYLNSFQLDLENIDNIKVCKKLVNVINSLSVLDNTKDSYKKILIDKLKHTKEDFKPLKNAVNIKDIYKETVNEDEYIFILGFNQDILPKMEKDIEYITDSTKNEVDMYTTKEKNKRAKLALIYILSNIKNLHISYKLTSPFSSFYPSSLINDLKLNIIKPLKDDYSKSNIYNELRLGEKLDLFYKYGVEDEVLNKLGANYKIPYNTYSNVFSGISKKMYLSYLKEPLNLSYTILNDYSECEFKYYLKNVLRLSTYEEKFPNFLGNLYHKILSLYEYPNFDFEEEYNKYIENRELSSKEKIFLVKIKKDILELIDALNKQKLITGYNNSFKEKYIEIPLDNKKISVLFKGFVDNIMYYVNKEETYFTVIDYKTGTIDTNIEPMKYGLHMQLPIYLYLIKYSNIFTKPIFTGIYYQNILYNYPTCTTTLEYEKNKKDRLKLQGYSTEDNLILEKFDTTYEKSEYIKSMSYTEEKGFGNFAKVMNNNTVDSMIEYTKNYISKTTDKILSAEFSINPKYYDGKNISCLFCNFKDICFMKEANLNYLKKVDDLSFLDNKQ